MIFTTAAEVGEAILSLTGNDLRRMTEIETKSLLVLTLVDIENNWPNDDNDEEHLLVSIAKRRLKSHNISVTNGAIYTISSWSDRPGIVVMYCAVLHALTKKLNKTVTMSDVCSSFAYGIPTTSALERIWDQQKVKGVKGNDNLLDYPDAW